MNGIRFQSIRLCAVKPTVTSELVSSDSALTVADNYAESYGVRVAELVDSRHRHQDRTAAH